MTFRITGNVLPSGTVTFSAMVSSVLRGALGDRPASIKTVARWTGARERTVKNWFAGVCSPSGDHFRDIVRHCPEMLDAFLTAADRNDCLAMARVAEARRSLHAALAVLDRLGGPSFDGDAASSDAG